jgi:oxygen-independent coproporphyrinogen-3 oxidase
VDIRRVGDVDGWAAALAGELGAVSRDGRFPLAPELETLYVGGGTPSLLGPDAMAALAHVLGPERLADPTLEWTAEANPESFSPAVATGWRAAGVNRVSLGVQSFSEYALRWMGRLHGPDGARRAVATARRAGLDDLSVDLIFALPDEVDRVWREDLDDALGLEPPHVSLYGLTTEAGTPLGKSVAEGRVTSASEERYREEYLYAVERLIGAGYVHYEVSNFARPGHASRHNRVYWEGGTYLGLGNGAHSFSDPLRRWNLREWDDYSSVATAGELPVASQEEVGEAARQLERVWLWLRTDSGVPCDKLNEPARILVRRWLAAGLAQRSEQGGGGGLCLTPAGWLLLDRLVVDLDHALGGALGGRDQASSRGYYL